MNEKPLRGVGDGGGDGGSAQTLGPAAETFTQAACEVGREACKGASTPSLGEFKEVFVAVPPGCSEGRLDFLNSTCFPSSEIA